MNILRKSFTDKKKQSKKKKKKKKNKKKKKKKKKRTHASKAFLLNILQTLDFFLLLLGFPLPTMGHSLGDSLTNPMLKSLRLYKFDP